MAREAYFIGGPLDGKVMMVEMPRVRLSELTAAGHRKWTYVSRGHFVHIRWDLPDDGSLPGLPHVFMTGMGRKIMDVRIFELVEEEL